VVEWSLEKKKIQKMKKNWFYFIIVVVLLGAVYFLSREDEKPVVREENRDFSVKDTASITKIVISDKTPSEAVVERRPDGQWYVNGQYPVRKDAIQLVLETLYRQSMRNYVTEAAKPQIIKQMAVSGKEVMVYAGEELIKHFYVGGNPQDLMGSYMMLHNATEPYVVHIEGFNGFLSVRYFTAEDVWRSRVICDLSPDKIKSLRILYPNSDEAGFEMQVNSIDDVRVLDEDGVEIDVNPQLATAYLSNFKNLQFEGLITDKDRVWAKKDSILGSLPVFEMEITDTYGYTTEVVGFFKAAQSQETDPEGNRLNYDRDRFYAQLNGDDMVLIQRQLFDRILRPLDYFRQAS
jgi:hypothetical protein